MSPNFTVVVSQCFNANLLSYWLGYCIAVPLFMTMTDIVQALISVQALVFDLAQLTCQKRLDCRNAMLRSSTILLGTSYSQIVVAVLLQDVIFERTLR